jgi:hypothetical protein
MGLLPSDGDRPQAVDLETSRRVLDPVDRASEILFGLIMVLTFTGSLSVSDAGRADVRAMLIGALGCNLAWGLIDAVMFLMATKAGYLRATYAAKAIREAKNPADGRRILATALPTAVLPALTEADLEKIRLHLTGSSLQNPRLSRQDYMGAVGVFLLVFLCTLPVVLPFAVWRDAAVALAFSNIIAVAMLFFTGYALGRYSGRPWRVGLSMVALGVALVALAIALGG